MTDVAEAGRRRLFDDIDQAVSDLEMAPAAVVEDQRPGRRRRRLRRPDEIVMNVVNHDGVLFVDGQLPPPPALGRRRRGPRAFGLADEVAKPVLLSQLEPNKIGQALEALDGRCNRNQGMRELRVDEGGPAPEAVLGERREIAAQKVLVLVHGTFSKTENWLEQFGRATNGGAFLRWMSANYDQVLAFDHPTLAVSPMLNAHRLNENLAEIGDAHIDVVCHSRGGLVTRWWLEALDRAPVDQRRAVFVGSPLNGTGLAAPANIRGSLSLLLNIGSVAADLATAIPFGAVVTQMFRIFTSVTSLAVKSPALDAALALVPGLSAQSRVSNNFELLRQRSHEVPVKGRYFAVRSNFETENVDWKFWKVFRNVKDRAMNVAADTVFDGPNDLVVDTASMSNLVDGRRSLPKAQRLDYIPSAKVHHTNYFEQEETLDQIMKWLA